MTICWRLFGFVAAFGVPFFAGACERDGAQLNERLRNRIEEAGFPARLLVRGEPLCASQALPRFYERRAYQPAWTDESGPLPRVEELVRFLREVEREGLRPADYHLDRIASALGEARGESWPTARTDLELLLTDAFLTCAAHLSRGRIHRETLRPECPSGDSNLAGVLEGALCSAGVRVGLEGLVPSDQGYIRLREALALYRGIAADTPWGVVSEGEKLQRGDRDPRLPALASRLAAEEDRFPEGAVGEEFDEAVEQAVRSFQKRHGLDEDGVVGRATLAALNVSAADRVRQIELNLDRWRSMPRDPGRRYILVNIPGFELQAFEGGREVLAMKVIVGRPDWPTRDFSDRMTYLVLNPSWHVPPKIATEEILPLVRKDLEYLAREEIEVYPAWSEDGEPLDPRSIDWRALGPDRFPFMLHQKPGPSNPLGRVKFMLPNPYDVYLHDTPDRSLFARAVRAASHGCVRLENALGLLDYVLQEDLQWTPERIRAALDGGQEQTIRLGEPIPLHLVYRTAWVAEDGVVQFRGDVYGLDRDFALAFELPLAPPR